jgi:hypothetical protein
LQFRAIAALRRQLGIELESMDDVGTAGRAHKE